MILAIEEHYPKRVSHRATTVMPVGPSKLLCMCNARQQQGATLTSVTKNRKNYEKMKQN